MGGAEQAHLDLYAVGGVETPVKDGERGQRVLAQTPGQISGAGVGIGGLEGGEHGSAPQARNEGEER